MGTRITAKGVDAEAYATEMGVPVRTGIRGIFLTNTNLDKIVWNYAPGSAGKGVAVAITDITDKYTEVDGLMSTTPKYIESKVTETDAFTIFAIAKIDKTSDWPAAGVGTPPEQRIMLISDYGGAPLNYGVGLYASRGDACALTVGIKTDGTSDMSGQTQHVVVDFDKYLLLSARYDMATRTMKIKNHLTGLQSAAISPTGTTRVAAGRGYRLGAASAGLYGGKAKIVAAQMHNVHLSDADTDRNAAFLKAYAERRGITF